MPPADSDRVALYATIGTLPDRGMAKELVPDYFDALYRLGSKSSRQHPRLPLSQRLPSPG